MANKLQQISALSNDTAKSLSDYTGWTLFLQSASWQYKYPFEDQLLIFAQRPNAKACASIEMWNNKLHRWVNKGSKGIALLRESNNKYYLDYVFDVADTNSFYGNDIKLWQYHNKYDEDIIETLEGTFGELQNRSTLTDAIISAARNSVSDSKSDYLSELKYAKENSFLGELDELNIDLEFQRTAEASVAYMIMARLGLEPDDTFEREDFQHIIDLNTPETIGILGNAVSSITETALREISETIRAAEREEKVKSKFFAENSRTEYNVSKEENQPTLNDERTDIDGSSNNLHADGRLSDTELDGAGEHADNRQIRTDEENLPQAEQTKPIFHADDNGQVDGTLVGDRQDSERTGTENSITNGTDGGRDGADESGQSANVDRTNEQFSPRGRGNRTERNSLQLSLFDDIFPTESTQQNMIREAERLSSSSAFSMPQQIIDEVLTTGGNSTKSIIKICAEFSKNKSLEDKAGFLQNEYDIGGKGFIFDGSKISVWWNEDGIRISRGDTAVFSNITLTWEDAANRVDELLDLGRFAPQETLVKVADYELKKAADSLWNMIHDIDDEDYSYLREMYPEDIRTGGYPDNTERIKEMLQNSAELDKLVSTTRALASSYENHRDIMRFSLYNPVRVFAELSDMQLERKTFTSEYTSASPERFITEDEINQYLIRGSDFDRGKIRIYQYFQEHTDKKERIAFLKNEYGIGGSRGNYNLNDDHNGKGIELSRGDIFNPFSKVKLSWSNVEARIDHLIKSNQYMTEHQISADIPKYLSEQEQQRIHTERTRFVGDANDLSDGEKQALLPKRLLYFADTMPKYEQNIIRGFGLDILIDGTELDIADMLKNADNRKVISECMHKVGGSASGVYERNNGYNLSKDVAAMQIITLHRIGDFYEIYGDEAEKAAEALQITVTTKTIDGETVQMTGIPSFRVEDYSKILSNNGYAVAFADDKEKTETLDVTEMTEDDKQGFIDSVETAMDYGGDTANAQKEIADDELSSELVGKELTIDDRKFIVDSINTEFNTVSLKDVTFQNSTGFPIFRSESIDFVQAILNEQEQPTLEMPEFEKPKSSKVANTVIYPEIPMSERHNFSINNDELGYGTPSEKFEGNAAAIRTLKAVEGEHRLATPEEQAILSNYVGWGGLADCFEEQSSKYQQLKALLTDDEYSQARASTLTSHFTSPVIIKAMYKALSNMGFTQGNILEPSCGIGNFMGLMPESMASSKMYGIELDSITGRIAQQLYQKNSVAVQGYEDTSLPDSFFDVAVGNVPFGDFTLLDKKYNKRHFLIHDYFFAKTLDKVRPGGIVAFITSSGTMDKRTSKVRKYIAQRADLLGAIRLPNTAFKKNAGTEVTADILFLQKRDRMTDIMPDWVNVGKIENEQYQNEHQINQYFIDNPDMIMGELTEVSGPFGPTLTCMPDETSTLAEQFDGAIQNIHAQITEYEFDDISDDESISIPADPNVKNFSFTVVDGDIYFRENSVMNKVELNATAQNRIKGMIEIRDCVRTLIEYQTEGYPENDIKEQQAKLNTLYDNFTRKYGLINSRGNNMAFSDDSSYFLLCSLEIINENGELERKADMFTKRTIGAKTEITKVDTADEALAISLGEKARIDIDFMSQLTGKSEDELYSDLKGVIFLNPLYEENGVYFPKYLTADEYLSGNVREKLAVAKSSAAISPEDYAINVDALEKVQPKDLTASEITVKLGSTWIPPEYIRDFVFELLEPNYYAKSRVDVKYSKLTGDWYVVEKSADRGVKATNTYGTKRINAYKIIEESLNQKDVRIFDYVENEKGNKVAVLNRKETTIAQQKQDAIKQAFNDWIWRNPERREKLTKLYNEKFNSVRPREYDGSHITFNGINPEIALRKHQKDAVARVMYGGNSLLGHVVGAGKTWTMVAAAMEMKRLGLCNKSLFVVPNHLTEQWASEFLQLYPAANIMVATKKDFEMKNRKKFCGRIATGNYDAVIIGHSQFEKIPMSAERQRAILEKQLDEILMGIGQAKADKAENFTVKQMEKTKRGLENKLAKLNDQDRKDNVVTFEELGVDRLFVDESHGFKNLFLYTKMRNVGGIAQTEAQKSSDLFMKSQYLDEITGGKGLIFATGTPISNSIVEMYTVQRYLQYGTLVKNDLQHFDSWASTFGETVTAIELAPEGTGYRAKTRFAKFFNLPELMSMFKEVADIQTADMLNLPVPKAEFHTVSVEPTELQKEMVSDLAERAEKVRNKEVDPSTDNMLTITNDGRKLALDQRMMNPLLPDDEHSKVSVCANNVYDIWQKTADKKATQLAFCDLSTPKTDGTFSVYNSIKEKLIAKGIPESDIAFIHDADNEIKKKELFAKVRKGDVRVLLGSTAKMGAGTNVQRLLYASHDLDCPWRPADLEQRAGRIIRQGNTNEEVHIYRYVTKDTFDSYSWQTVENKQKFISQIMTSKSPVRSADDIDETALSYAEIKALATGNPHIKEKMELDTEVAKLKLIKASFMSQIYDLEDKVIKYYPNEIASLTARIKGLEADISATQPKLEDKFNTMTIDGLGYFEKEKAGNALIERCKKMTSEEPVLIGDYRGFNMELSFDTMSKVFNITLKNSLSYKIDLGTDVFGNIQRLDNAIDSLPTRCEGVKEKLEDTKQQFETAKVECKRKFPQEDELTEKLSRLAAVDALLNMDKKERDDVDISEPDEEIPQKKKKYEMER